MAANENMDARREKPEYHHEMRLIGSSNGQHLILAQEACLRGKGSSWGNSPDLDRFRGWESQNLESEGKRQ